MYNLPSIKVNPYKKHKTKEAKNLINEYIEGLGYNISVPFDHTKHRFMLCNGFGLAYGKATRKLHADFKIFSESKIALFYQMHLGVKCPMLRKNTVYIVCNTEEEKEIILEAVRKKSKKIPQKAAQY